MVRFRVRVRGVISHDMGVELGVGIEVVGVNPVTAPKKGYR
jgi:hypothetical protein